MGLIKSTINFKCNLTGIIESESRFSHLCMIFYLIVCFLLFGRNLCLDTKFNRKELGLWLYMYVCEHSNAIDFYPLWQKFYSGSWWEKFMKWGKSGRYADWFCCEKWGNSSTFINFLALILARPHTGNLAWITQVCTGSEQESRVMMKYGVPMHVQGVGKHTQACTRIYVHVPSP